MKIDPDVAAAHAQFGGDLIDMQRRYESEHATVSRIWKALGISTYEQAGGKEISEIVADWKARAVKAETALSLRPAETRVKPLEWKFDKHMSMWHADTVCGRYSTWDIDGGIFMCPGDRSGTLAHGDIEEAKALCQSDFEKRIKASISEPAQFDLEYYKGCEANWREVTDWLIGRGLLDPQDEEWAGFVEVIEEHEAEIEAQARREPARAEEPRDLVKDAETMQCCNPGIDAAIAALLEENKRLRAEEGKEPGTAPDLQGTSEPYTPEEAARLLAKCEEAAAALKAPPSKPVAWLTRNANGSIGHVILSERATHDFRASGHKLEPLYAAPSSSTLEITEEAVEAVAKAVAQALGREHMNDWHLGVARAALEASLPFLSQTGGEKSDGWRTIESAPKDGTHFLAYELSGEMYRCCIGASGFYHVLCGQPCVEQPSPDYWLPLDALPERPAKEETPA